MTPATPTKQPEQRNSPAADFHRRRAIATMFIAALTLVGHFRPAWLGLSQPVALWMVLFWCTWAVGNWPVVIREQRQAVSSESPTVIGAAQARGVGYWVENGLGLLPIIVLAVMLVRLLLGLER